MALSYRLKQRDRDLVEEAVLVRLQTTPLLETLHFWDFSSPCSQLCWALWFGGELCQHRMSSSELESKMNWWLAWNSDKMQHIVFETLPWSAFKCAILLAHFGLVWGPNDDNYTIVNECQFCWWFMLDCYPGRKTNSPLSTCKPHQISDQWMWTEQLLHGFCCYILVHLTSSRNQAEPTGKCNKVPKQTYYSFDNWDFANFCRWDEIVSTVFICFDRKKNKKKNNKTEQGGFLLICTGNKWNILWQALNIKRFKDNTTVKDLFYRDLCDVEVNWIHMAGSADLIFLFLYKMLPLYNTVWNKFTVMRLWCHYAARPEPFNVSP